MQFHHLFYIIMTMIHLSAEASQIRSLYRTGQAFNEEGQLIYTEKHLLKYRGDKLISLNTDYLSPKNLPIGTFKSLANHHTFVPNYTFDDYRSHRQVNVLVKDQTIYARTNVLSKRKEQEKKLYPNTVAGQGLYFYMAKHLRDFAQNPQRVDDIQFYLPLKGNFYSFNVKVKNYNKEELTYLIQSNNWFISLFAPTIEATYRLNDGHLTFYKGPSNFLDQNRKPQIVTITYK